MLGVRGRGSRAASVNHATTPHQWTEDEERTLLWLKRELDWPYHEVAAYMGSTVGACTKRLNRPSVLSREVSTIQGIKERRVLIKGLKNLRSPRWSHMKGVAYTLDLLVDRGSWNQ